MTGSGRINGTGNALNNVIKGNAAANILDGGLGSDTLTGGLGADTFWFNDRLSSSSNVDRITDFSVIYDTIARDNGIFTRLGAEGQLNAGSFRIGTSAADANDFVIYNSALGSLSYDADGNGAGAAIIFATLAMGLALTADDFLIV